MRDSLIILAFFAVGVVLGVSGVLPFDISQTDIAMYALYALIFAVGFSIGNNPDILSSFRKLNPSLALLPLCTILGTLAASALLGLLLPHRSVPETMAVGSGFAYYSLSSIIITEYKGAELGTVALVANIVTAGTMVRSIGSHSCRRSHYCGCHPADNNQYLWRTVCRSVHISWVRSGFFRPFSGDIFLRSVISE